MTRALAALLALTCAASAQSNFGVGNPTAQHACAFGEIHPNPLSADCLPAQTVYSRLTTRDDAHFVAPDGITHPYLRKSDRITLPMTPWFFVPYEGQPLNEKPQPKLF